MKKILSLTLVLLLLITSAPFAAFAISSNGITMASISNDAATATLLDRTPGSIIGLSLSPAIGSAILKGDTVEMTGLTANTAYTLTVNEKVTANVPKEYSLERRWISTGLFSGNFFYYYLDDQMVEHEAVLANIYYYNSNDEKIVAQNIVSAQ